MTSLNDVVCEDGGRLVELHKGDFGQISLRQVLSGSTVGGHLHPGTNEKWWVLCGEAIVRLGCPDGTRELHNVEGCSKRIIDVPAGAGHEISNVGDDDVWFVFHADRVYDPENPDKEDWSW
jgi:UDP-2-acetamido-2,6-beta-L-arabino-hexul-4-ose reductase